MRGERVICLHCRKPVHGLVRIGGTIVFRYTGAYVTMNMGTVPCMCGATLIIVAGAAVEFAPPAPRDAERLGTGAVTEVISMEVV